MDKVMGPLQKLGKALMGAVAVLPVAALMTGIGYFLDARGGERLSFLASVFQQAGGAVLDNLGVLFAIAISFGLAKDSNGAAALSGFLGFFTVTKLVGPEAVANYRGIEDPAVLEGDQALEWAAQGWDAVGPANVLLGIFVGVLAAWTYNRFHATKLPDALAFFSGRRLVPILTSLFSIVLAGVFYFLWPVLYTAFFNFGQWIQGMGAIGAGVYGVSNRLLIPTGLHHALNAIFWFDVVGINDIGKFLGGADTLAAAQAAGDAASCPGVWDGSSCEVVGVIGQYQAGFFPVMMFGLPGAALAMTLRAKPARRKVVGSLMLAGALASFLTGVTEPIEFSFMFVAPLLFVVHAILMGISMAIASFFDWTAGFGFSAGFFDMLLSSQNPLANQWWMLLVMGVAYFFIYFGLFYYLIGKFNLKTPGRGDDEEDGSSDGTDGAEGDDKLAAQAARILDGLGGAENLNTMEYCTTRLRTTVHDPQLVKEQALKSAGVAGVYRPSAKGVQVIIGPNVQFVHDEVRRQMEHPVAVAAPAPAPAPAPADSPEKAGVTELSAPTEGKAIPLEEVADPAFAGGQVGPGFAIVPGNEDELVVASPVAGEVTMVAKTKHAVAVRSAEGLDVLVHIGMDTVGLRGAGFEVLVSRGDAVEPGHPLVRVDAAALRERGIDLTTPVVVTNKKKVSSTALMRAGDVAVGQHVMEVEYR
ncbi:N-acetylglucosamine-specific PTS transporter subunit IIBC [uncultured Corynebacterium sp.]|uniref:N-acetylglucosamine-specific PTS transporter subunit IIBC n=1 Tax=uncultured Corynebacterium sp. TaxID=159447 RepID=UPI0026014F9B|nr:N-acetylglucosamine-specific PTS transporter subunit IIBC [uncultured Corynebacterium sp.]